MSEKNQPAPTPTQETLTPEKAELLFQEIGESYQTFNNQRQEDIKEQLSKYTDALISNLPESKRAEALRQKAYCQSMSFRVEITQKLVHEGHAEGGDSGFAGSEFSVLLRIGNPKNLTEAKRFKLQIENAIQNTEKALTLGLVPRQEDKAKGMLKQLKEYKKRINAYLKEQKKE
jgi:hypothetical protein